MPGVVATDKLKPHPKNGFYFSDVTGEKYEEIKRSIATHGIRDPLKVTPDYIIISGHQRWRIAKDLGLSHVPVEVLDVDEREAEYLLIAENVERRGEAESDPMKKARIAKFLKEYWGIRDKGNNRKFDGQFVHQKTMKDVGDVIGESAKKAQRLLKLNDLIPEIQSLVSAGKLGTTAAEQIAYLTPDEQKALLNALGESLTQKTVAEMTQLRRAIEEERKKREEVERSVQERIRQVLNRERADWERRLREVTETNQRLQAEVEEKDEMLRKKDVMLQEIEQEKRRLEVEMQKKDQKYKKYEHLEDFYTDTSDIARHIRSATSLSGLYVEIENLLKTKLAPIRYSRAILECRNDEVAMRNLRRIVEVVGEWYKEMIALLPDDQKIIDVEAMEL